MRRNVPQRTLGNEADARVGHLIRRRRAVRIMGGDPFEADHVSSSSSDPDGSDSGADDSDDDAAAFAGANALAEASAEHVDEGEVDPEWAPFEAPEVF